jgi:16S rRNA (guanine527-N7)-methyltransferase
MKRNDLTDERIREALLPYGVAVDSELCEEIRVYTETLLRWNEKISLTTVTDPDEILRVHFGESFFAASVAGIADGRVADIGTGPGFPGIPIRMVRPGMQLTLVEPVAKKTAFLGEILRTLGISDVRIIRCRMEELPAADLAGIDLITARALGKYDALLRWSKTRISQNGSILLLLGDSDAAQISRNRSWLWREPVQVPGSRGRFVLLGSASAVPWVEPCST